MRVKRFSQQSETLLISKLLVMAFFLISSNTSNSIFLRLSTSTAASDWAFLNVAYWCTEPEKYIIPNKNK